MADTTTTVPFFKKSKRPTTSRTRNHSPPPSSSAAPSTSQVVAPTRKLAANLLAAGTKRTLAERDNDAQEANHSFDVNWSTGTASHALAAQQILDGDEAAELLAKRTRLDPDTVDDVPDDGKYHGTANYKKHLKKSEDTPKAMRVGPQRSNASTIRTVTIVDYQPDVCKDYKETGYCGFGDTCKFLHDRGTYLAGWQLDKLAANPKAVANNADSDSDSEDEIPFACFICRNPYTDPVVTRCSHYFCSACAIKRFSKTPKCAACGAPTSGIFNRADKVVDKMKQRKLDEDGVPDSGQVDAPIPVEVQSNASDSDSEDGE